MGLGGTMGNGLCANLDREVLDLNCAVVYGCSRLGKAVLLATATDERFTFAYANSTASSVFIETSSIVYPPIGAAKLPSYQDSIPQKYYIDMLNYLSRTCLWKK